MENDPQNTDVIIESVLSEETGFEAFEEKEQEFEWKFHAKPVKNDNDKEYLTVSLECSGIDGGLLPHMPVDVEFSIFNEVSGKSFAMRREFKFDWNTTELAIAEFKDWKEVLDDKDGFLKDDDLMIKVHIKILEGGDVLNTFKNPVEHMTDVVLVVEGQKLHVGKQVLAMNSPYFHRMFYGNFDDKDKKEVELKDVRLSEFVKLLNLIYPSTNTIDYPTYEDILKTADRFQVTSVLEQGEKFLREDDLLGDIEKLIIAEKYHFAKLQSQIIKQYDTCEKILGMTKENKFKELGQRTVQLLMMKLADMQSSKPATSS